MSTAGLRAAATALALVVIAGCAVPFLLEVLEKPLRLHAATVAPVLVLLGGFALRWIIVAAGQA